MVEGPADPLAPAWASLADEQLLNVRLCNLDLRIDGTDLPLRITRVHAELQARGLVVPHDGISEARFSPDGVPGVAFGSPTMKRRSGVDCMVFLTVQAMNDLHSGRMNVVSVLELLKRPYSGCNPRGLLLARDRSLSKKRLAFPLMVKSLTQEASIGISQASVVDSDDKLNDRVTFIHERIGTAAIVEQHIDGGARGARTDASDDRGGPARLQADVPGTGADR